ncbi:MAG: sulfotransferase [Gemmatimonadales bacterium]|nr:sulfotransferase [Gemmatimonadales bacterium]
MQPGEGATIQRAIRKRPRQDRGDRQRSPTVVNSFLEIVRTKWRKRGWGRSAAHAGRIAARWVRCIEAMERNRDHVCVIRYEDLVTRPRAELGRLAEWLAIDPAGFDAERVASVRGTNIGKHKTGLTREELTTVMAIAGPAMARLGYT